MKIDVGMYVRTKNHNGFAGGIGKIEKIQEDKIHKTKWITLDRSLDGISFLVNISEIVKTSYDIIDLIEVGDYVNGYKVVQVSKSLEGRKYITTEAYHKINYGNIFEKEIKSIVTKEQFKAIEYKID